MSTPKTIIKPWGKEEWLELNEKYCYKRIYINAGYKTSFQYHDFKRETNYIISGEAEIWLEDDNGIVQKTIMTAGQYFNVTPPKKHRVIALTDIILQEVSTPEVDDVIRIEDDANRKDGKIEGEHKNPAVLILSAGLGSRLNLLTSNINKALLPIKNKAIISHIIEKFPKTYDFVIAVGYKSESLIDYCKITYPDINFKFVNILPYEGINSGPGISALQCKEYLQRPFYITTCDCLIDKEIPNLDGNWIGVWPTGYPEIYSTVSLDKDNVIDFMDKKENGYDMAFIGLSAIWDYSVFWDELEKNITSGELISAFKNPAKYPTLKGKKLKWFDTGNYDDYIEAKNYFNDNPLSLHKDNNEITYYVNDKFLKYNPNLTVQKNRERRAKVLFSKIPPNFKSINNFITYDWVDGDTLYNINSYSLFVKFLDELKLLTESQIPSSKEGLKKFYIDKTKNRMNLFIENFGNSYLTESKNINSVICPSLSELMNKIDFDSLTNNPFYKFFHGDLQFDNVIYGNNKFYYIDWRDSFADLTDGGDIYYDLSKLYGGCIIPYNLMKNIDNIKLFEGEYSVSYDYSVPSSLKLFKKTYEEWLLTNGYDINKVKLITSLIYLNMSPLHEERFGKMLWFKSIEMLNELYNK